MEAKYKKEANKKKQYINDNCTNQKTIVLCTVYFYGLASKQTSQEEYP